LHQALLGLGLSLDETLSYVHLLGKQSSSNELAELTGFANRRISEALKGLELKGLIKRIPGRPVRFAPVAPGLALPALVRQREREVQSIAEVVGTAARKLDALAQPAETTSYIEVVTGREGVRAQCNALELGAQWEVLGMMKPPLLVSSPETSNQEQEEALSRGIRMRWLYERSLFDRPNTLEEVRGFAALGEESRVLPRLPAKIIIADRKIALVHVTERSVKGPHPVAILTRHQELVEVLHELFEVLWAEATVLFGGAGPPSADAGNDSTKIVELLLTGMKDESIARQLGLSKRTLARRISQLMRDWKTETRFQAGFRMGYEAAQRDAGADMGDAP
jgi:sugar-specific transcriptional regulator TrmB